MGGTPQPWRRLSWTLPDWILYAHEIDARRVGAPRAAAAARHISRFPAADVSHELDRAVLRALVALICARVGLFSRAGRGWRADCWTTAPLVDAKNQLAKLDRINGRNANE